MAECNLQRVKVFLKNWHVSFIGPYHPTSMQQSKSFIYTCRLFYAYSKELYKMRVCVDWVVASACFEPSVLGKECVVYFKKEYAG